MTAPLRIRGDVSRGERREHRELRSATCDAPGAWRWYGIFSMLGDQWDSDRRTGPADRRRHPLLDRVLQLVAENVAADEARHWREVIVRHLREAGEREAELRADNARLHKLLADTNALLAKAEPSYERLAAGDAAGACAVPEESQEVQ